MKWKSPGYHYIIKDDGEAVQLLDESLVSNGVAGFNHNSIHISYIGGIDNKGYPVDNRSDFQKVTTMHMLYKLKAKYPTAEIKGHRDFPGVKKACPSFDVKEWLNGIKFDQA
jgi:N-acetylmuramoyl-L-alanine amidase